VSSWYFARRGEQHGPFPEAEFVEKIRRAELGPEDLAWRDGMEGWKKLSEIEDFRVALSERVAPPATTTASPYQPPATQEWTPPARAPGPPVETYLWQSIVVTLLCCLPFGIPAIVYASRVETLRNAGDLHGAMAASRSARLWCWVSFWCWLGPVLLYLVLVMFGTIASEF